MTYFDRSLYTSFKIDIYFYFIFNAHRTNIQKSQKMVAFCQYRHWCTEITTDRWLLIPRKHDKVAQHLAKSGATNGQFHDQTINPDNLR